MGDPTPRHLPPVRTDDHRSGAGLRIPGAPPLKNPFPTKNQLLQACRGDLPIDHPVLHTARTLTVLHERRLSESCCAHEETDRQRAASVRTIDNWLDQQLPPSHGAASVHTETVGEVIDRLAQLTAAAYAALTSACEWDLWDAWERLAELAIGYEDLATDVNSGRRRLPGCH
ncbi:DUF4254 domain-containing protein [Nocardia sp. NPDC060256]|uniref:DUF4254 domain-containing protein n=1 Tax=unclassified Nocardia TaxID=2637762 RepID=UPI0036537DCE